MPKKPTKAKPKLKEKTPSQKKLPVKVNSQPKEKTPTQKKLPAERNSQSKGNSQPTTRKNTNSPAKTNSKPNSKKAKPTRWITCMEAAHIIGCHKDYVRHLARNGKLEATQHETIPGSGLHYWMINPKSIQEFMAVKQTTGYPRGRPR